MAKPLVVLVANTSWYLWKFRASTMTALKRDGFDVVCLAPKDHCSGLLVQELGVDYMPLSVEGADRGWVTEARSLWRTLRIVRQLHPRYVFNFTIKANVYSGIACWLCGIPFANNVSGLGTAFLHDKWLFRRLRQLYIWINGRANHVFFQNPTDYSLFKQLGLSEQKPVTLLPGSGVNLEIYRKVGLPDGPLTFLMVARLLGDKGVREFVGAARRMCADDPQLRFILVGPLGVDNKTAIGAAELESWQGEGVIDYRGELADVRDALAECHVFVLPSYREGMPRTVLEAAAMGRPAIVADVPGCRDAVLVGKTALLCEPKSVDSLVSAMRQYGVIDRDELARMGAAARELAEARFSEKIVVDAYMARLVRVDRS